jgi:hypothetical protein
MVAGTRRTGLATLVQDYAVHLYLWKVSKRRCPLTVFEIPCVLLRDRSSGRVLIEVLALRIGAMVKSSAMDLGVT